LDIINGGLSVFGDKVKENECDRAILPNEGRLFEDYHFTANINGIIPNNTNIIIYL